MTDTFPFQWRDLYSFFTPSRLKRTGTRRASQHVVLTFWGCIWEQSWSRSLTDGRGASWCCDFGSVCPHAAWVYSSGACYHSAASRPASQPHFLKSAQRWLKSVISFCRGFVGWHPLSSLSFFATLMPLCKRAHAEDCHAGRRLRVVSSPASFSSGSDVYQHEGFGPMQAAVCLPRSHHDCDLCVKRKTRGKVI